MANSKKKMGNKPFSPSLTAFGFSRNKRSSSGGEGEASPSKRARQESSEASGVALAAREGDGAAVARSAAAANTQSPVVDLSQDSSGSSNNSVQEITRQQEQQQISNRATNQNKSSTIRLSTLSASPPRSPTKPIATSPQRPPRPINAIGLVAVTNPKSHILCTTTAANARNSLKNSSIKQLFREATLGRTSNSSWRDANFVDLGIEAGAKGVSRKHIRVLRVNGLGGENEDDPSVATAQSATTAQSGVSAATAQSITSSNPTVMIQVLPHPQPPKETLKVIIHRTRRNKRRVMDLKQGECKTLRVGDAIEFMSDENRCFCVVAFHNPEEDSGKTVEAQRLALEDRESDRRVEGVDQSQTQPLFQPDLTQEIADVDRMEVEVADSKLLAHDDVETAKEKDVSAEEKRGTNEPEAAGESVQKVMAESCVGSTKAETIIESSVEHAMKVKSEQDHAIAVAESNQSSVPKPEEKIHTTNISEVKSEQHRISPAKSEVSSVQFAGESQGVPNPTVAKGDDVRVMYQLVDAFGIEHEEWHYGKVGLVRTNPSNNKQSINIKLDAGEGDKFDFPHPKVEKVDDISQVYSKPLQIGDCVECHFRNYDWYHGRVADISKDGSTCEVFYHDQSYEINIPTDQNKIRVSSPIGSNYEWLINRPTLIGRKGTITAVETSYKSECRVVFDDKSEVYVLCDDICRGGGAYLLSNGKPRKRKNATANYNWLIGCAVLIGQKGTVKEAPRDDSSSECRIAFDDGTEASISCDNVVRGAFSCLLQGIGIKRQYIWPETEKFLCRAKNQQEASIQAKPAKPASKRGKKESKKRVSIMVEDNAVDCGDIDADHRIVFRAGPHSVWQDKEDAADEDITDPDGAVALPLPPGIPIMLWHAINCPEAKTGANMFHEFLCVHDRVPGQDIIRKLWQLIIKGPKADGHNIHFKEPFMTELASQYVYTLIHQSGRLIRSDGSTLFGPADWNDIESLLSQSIKQTEDMVAGKRLADGLHLAARGSKVLYLMLRTELRDVNLMSVQSCSFDSMSLQAKPTVKQFRDKGVRESLKSVVKNTTKCLVRHSRFILDVDDFHPEAHSNKKNFYDDSCSLEARESFDNLGNVLCYAAFLFCMSERVSIDDQSCLLLIRDEFDKELHRSLDDAPDMDKTSHNKFVKILREAFIGVLREDFAMPLFVGLAKLMGFGKELVNLGLIVD